MAGFLTVYEVMLLMKKHLVLTLFLAKSMGLV